MKSGSSASCEETNIASCTRRSGGGSSSCRWAPRQLSGLALQLLGHLLGRRLGEVEQARLACSARQLGRWTDAISRGSESTCQHAEPLARRGRVEQHRLDEGVGLRAARTVASGVGRGHAWRWACTCPPHGPQ